MMSCNSELTDIPVENDSETAQLYSTFSEENVRNGRLYFPTKASLEEIYGALIDAEDEEVASFIDGTGITSLRPIVTEANEEAIYNQTLERLAKLKLNSRFMASENASKIDDVPQMIDEIDNLEVIIADDVFGAMLNSDGEIQVGEKIYKYTDVGIFESDVEEYEGLIGFLEQENIADNLLYLTVEPVQNQFISLYPSDIMSPIEGFGGVSFFPGNPSSGYSPSNPPSSNPTPPVTDPNTQMANFINSLQNCNTYNTFLQGLFGDHNMCTDKYESKRRVKTKAYNANYYLVYHLGAKVKHQKKGWTGFWAKEAADEIRLGVLIGTFSYDYSSYFNPTPAGRSQSVFNAGNRLYFDAQTFWSPNFNSGMYTMTGYSLQNYPKIFKGDYYIEDILPINFSSSNPSVDFGLYSALQAGNEQLTASNLNNLFWNQTGGLVKTLGNLYESLGQSKPNNNITYSYNATPLGKIVIAKTKYKHEYNKKDVETTFDWGFQVGFKISDDGDVSPSVTTPSMKKPQDYRVIMYGIAKKNGGWHGSKMNTGIN